MKHQHKAQTGLQQANSPIDWASMSQLAAEHGYALTAEDLATTLSSGDQELTEAELSQAIGAKSGGLDFLRGRDGNDIVFGGDGSIEGGSGNDFRRR